MKALAKKIIVAVLGWQVRRLRDRNQFKVVAVAGSIGKTSTKIAIGSVLKQRYRVQYQDGNYNDLVSVPLVFFGRDMPSLFNPFAWALLIIKNEFALRRPYPYDAVVVELGTDYPGNVSAFGAYLRADIGVLTAITPEHMEYFKTLDAVAAEELSVAEYSKKVLVNIDWCDRSYLKKLSDYTSYSVRGEADYSLRDVVYREDGYSFELWRGTTKLLNAKHESIAETQLHSICAAMTIGHLLNLSSEELLAGIEAIKPVAGRMKRLAGINGSTILDDTYNASPEATKAALDTLYKMPAPQKFAILGNMNELGSYSEQAHAEIGEYCDPEQLEAVVTIGKDANAFLAVAAEHKGCTVKTCISPIEAADYLGPKIKQGAVILAKGSQNGVFAEEAVKRLLANPSDEAELVRQGPYWLKKKKEFLE